MADVDRSCSDQTSEEDQSALNNLSIQRLTANRIIDVSSGKKITVQAVINTIILHLWRGIIDG